MSLNDRVLGGEFGLWVVSGVCRYSEEMLRRPLLE